MYGTPQIAGSRGRYYLGSPLSSRPVRRRLARLGALTAQQAAQQVFPNAPRSSSAGHNMATFNVIQASAAAGQLLDPNGAPAYIPGSGDCAGVSLAAPSIVSMAGGIALKFAATAGPAAPVVLLAGGIAQLFGAILGHHAAAVSKERSILCAAVPAANQALQLIDQTYQSGQAGAQDCIAALNGMPPQFDAQVASIRQGADPTVSGECNAACVMSTALKAIVLLKASVYQDLVTQQNNATAAAVTNPAGAVQSTLIAPVEAALASSGLPSWILPAAAFFALWEFL